MEFYGKKMYWTLIFFFKIIKRNKMSQEISFNGAVNSHHFFIILFIVIISFILVSLWYDFLLKFYYEYLGFDSNNIKHSFFLAAFMTFIVFVIAYSLKKTTDNEK